MRLVSDPRAGCVSSLGATSASSASRRLWKLKRKTGRDAENAELARRLDQ